MPRRSRRRRPLLSEAANTAKTKFRKDEEKTVEATRSRAEVAASHFAGEPAPLASINQPPFAAHGSMAAQPAMINAALQQQQAQTTPAGTTVAVTAPSTTNCTTGRYTGEPFGMNFKDLDLKDFFRLIHEISGLNVVLDPSVKGSVTIVLDDVPWDQALAIVLDNNGLACTLQGNVLRIATLDTMKVEAESRRAQQEAQALAVPKQTITRYLSYGHAKDAMPVIKKFLSARGDVVADDRSNALIVEDIPSVLPKVEELIRMLDRKTPEVEIEARVVASTRTFARDIGTQLGAGFGSGNNAVGGATANSPVKVTLPGGQVPRFITGVGDATSIPLFSNLGATGPTSGIEFTNATAGFRLDFILHHGGKPRSAEDPVTSAHHDAEQYFRADPPGFTNPGGHAGTVGRSAHGNLRGRLPAFDSDPADHGGKHDFPEYRRGKYRTGFQPCERFTIESHA